MTRRFYHRGPHGEIPKRADSHLVSVYIDTETTADYEELANVLDLSEKSFGWLARKFITKCTAAWRKAQARSADGKIREYELTVTLTKIR